MKFFTLYDSLLVYLLEKFKIPCLQSINIAVIGTNVRSYPSSSFKSFVFIHD